MRKRTILLGVAILVIGLFLLPQATSKFTGQHDWVDKDTIACTDCHVETDNELGSSDHHASVGGGGDDACRYCHQADFTAGLDGRQSWGAYTASDQVHAAMTVECLDCHGTDSEASDPSALSWNIDQELQETTEAHNAMLEDATQVSILLKANEACIACHTNVQKDVTFLEFTSFDITADVVSTPGTWTVTYGYA